MTIPVNKPIVDFIEDFKLQHPDDLIHFWCKAVYTAAGLTLEFTSQVMIITIVPKQLDTIYLFEAAIMRAGLPDMFPVSSAQIRYQEKECLCIEQDNLQVRLYPINKISFLEKDN